MGDYKPKRYEIAGVDLIGYRQPDGSIRLGKNDPDASRLPNFPKSIEVEGIVYTLELIRKNDERNSLPDNHSGKHIEWGTYV